MLRLMTILFGLACVPLGAAEPAAIPTLQRSQWNGYERLDFTVAGRPCLLVMPKTPAAGKPWIWRTEFFGHEPQTDVALLGHGWHLAFMDAKDLYGSPKAMALFGQFYANVVAFHGAFAAGRARGDESRGLYAFNFALAHPTGSPRFTLTLPCSTSAAGPGATALPRSGPNAWRPTV